MTAFTAAYLICGDDHGRIGERRARLRALAEAESGAGGVTVLEGEACTGDALVEALQTMTFALGRRFVIADGVQRLKEAEGEAVAAALDEIDPETTTVAFFGREDARARTPAALVDAVKRAGGHIGREDGVKPRELPAWLEEQARSLEVTLEHQGARALVAHVGARPQRLLRELEKLALEHGPGARLGVDEVDAAAAHSAEHKAYEIADALVRRDGAGATRALLELGEQGERPAGLLYGIVRRLRDAHTVAVALESGQAPAQVKRELRMAPWQADRLLSDVRKADAAAFERALVAMADLELETRGGGSLGEDTAAVRAIARATA